MINENIINDYFDGNLDSSSQEYLFEELSKNAEMRYDFNQQFAIKIAISRDTAAFVPSLESNERLFNSIGISAASSNRFGGFWNKYGSSLLTGVFTSLATVLIMMYLLPLGDSESTNINIARTQYEQYKERPSLVVELPDKINGNEESNLAKTPSNNSNVNVRREINLMKENINYLQNENKKLNEELENQITKNEAMILAMNSKQDSDKLKKNNQLFNENNKLGNSSVFASNFVGNNHFQGLRENGSNYIITNYGTVSSDNSIVLEAAIGRYYQNIGNDFIERNNTFSDNLRFTGLYKLDDEFALGADLRQENFYQEFTATNNEGSKIIYQQQPIVYSGSLLFRYYPNFIRYQSFRPNFDISIGAANIGQLARFGFGFDYSFFDNTYFYIKSDYTFLSFYHKDLNFSSDKFGTHIGLGIEF